MLSILKYTLNDDEFLITELSNIFGIGFASAKYILKILGVPLNLRVGSLLLENNSTYYNKLKQLFDRITNNIDSELKRLLYYRKINEMVINSYKGYRYNLRLPVRGQRTHTNNKTNKRNRD